MVDSPTCPRWEDAAQWDQWLAEGLPDSVRVHATECSNCALQLEAFDDIRSGLSDLAAVATGSMADVDLTDGVLERIDAEPVASPEGARRGRWWPVLVAAAAAFVFVVTRPASIQISAEPGATLVVARQSRAFTGQTSAPLPFSLRTDARQSARIEGDGWRAELRPSTHVDVRSRGADMNIKKTAAGAAGVLIALYAGSGLFTSATQTVETKGPVEIEVDQDGRLATRPLSGASRPEGEPSRTDAQATNATQVAKTTPSSADQKDPESATGAYWSDDAKTMLFVVSGEIFDAVSGAPVPDFGISAVATRSDSYGAPNRRTFTFEDRADGKFTLRGLGMGVWRVTARVGDAAPVTQTVELSDVSSDPYLVFAMSEGEQVSGLVVDARDQPVEDAQVGLPKCFIRKYMGKHCKLVKTDAKGQFSLRGIPAGESFALRATHPRHGDTTAPNLRRAKGSSEQVTLKLSGILKIFGRVTSGADATPVAGKIVSTDGGAKTYTDDDGRYALLTPLTARPGVKLTTITEAGHAVEFASYPTRRSARAITWVDAETHVAETEQNFALAMGTAQLRGRVTEADGTPVTGAAVHLANTTGWYAGGRGHQTFPEKTTTDNDGRFTIDNIPHRAGYNLRLTKGDRRERLGYVNIKEQSVVEAEFVLGGGRIRGRFVHAKSARPFATSGQTCSRIGARMVGREAVYQQPRCLDGGRFEFTGLAPGRYEVHNRVEWMSSPVKFSPKIVDVRADEVTDDVLLEVEGEESQTWRLRVTNAEGRYISGGHLRYAQGKTNFTSLLSVRDDGVTRVTLNRRYDHFFIDAPGYESARIDVKDRDPKALIVVKLKSKR